jgi:centromeric protein E
MLVLLPHWWILSFNQCFSSFEKLEDGNIKLQSRLEQEEAAKAALLSRIQRLTELILVSTKATLTPRLSQRPGPRRSYSFGEEEV